MPTKRLTSVAVALVAAAVAASAQAATSHPLTVTETRTLGHLRAVAPAYGWPLKPFDRQHPVRAFLDDPRIGANGGKAFHFGIDIAAADGTPVYAVTSGELYLSHGSLCVVAGAGHEFGYWHVRPNPQLVEHQTVHKHELLGWIAPNWGHVHFAERIGKTYVNPLRPGALGPYTDPVPPTVASINVVRTGKRLDLVAGAYDTPWPRVPGPWASAPVTPALLRWRVGTTGPWHVAADFTRQMLDRRLFDTIYAPYTTQNHADRPGTFAFYLAHDWRPSDGTYVIQVEASDTRSNTAHAAVTVTIAHGKVR